MESKKLPITQNNNRTLSTKKSKTIPKKISTNTAVTYTHPVGIEIYQSLINSSRSAIFLSQSEGKIVEVNKAAEKMFGYSKEELVLVGRKGILDENSKELKKMLREREKNGSVTGELVGIRKNGDKISIELTSSVFTDQLGQKLNCTIMQDISARKKVEQELLLMLNNTDEFFVLLNSELIIVNYNKQFENLYRNFYNTKIEKGKSIYEYVQPERKKITEDIYKKVLKGGVVFAEMPMISVSGEQFFYTIKYSSTKDEHGKVQGIFVSIRDITEDKKIQFQIAQQQNLLEQAETNYREIFEKANDAVFIYDKETTLLIDLNTKGCELIGRTKTEILNSNPGDYAANTPGFTQDIADKKLKIAAQGKPQLFEWKFIHTNGTVNWVEVNMQKANIAGTERILAYYRLINDRKKAEEEAMILKLNAEALINGTDDLIWSIDDNFTLTAANHSYLHKIKSLIGNEPTLGDNVLFEVFGKELNKKWKKYYQRSLAGEKFQIEENYFDKESNKTLYTLVSFNPIYVNSKPSGITCYVKDITSLKENEVALSTSVLQLENVMQSSLDMIITISKDNRIESISAACFRILGYKPEELVGKNLFDFIYHEDAEITKKTAENVMAGIINTNFYNRYVRKDGSLVYLEWTSKWNETAQRRYGVGRDVTAKIEADEKLKKSEKRFKSLVQDGGDMIAIIDAKGDYTYVSPTSLAILGYEPDEFNDQSAFSFIHEEDLEMVHHYFGILEKTKKIILPPFRFRHKNGEWRWVETTVTNLLDDDAVQGIVANSRDITEKKKIEDALVNTKENYKNLFENSPAPMFIFDFETLQIVDCNEEALLKYGYTKNEFLQLTIKDIRPIEDIGKIEETVKSENSYGAIHKNVWRHKKKNGEIMFMDISGHLMDYNGRRVSIVMLIDVTEKMKLENERAFEKNNKEALINNTEDLIWSVTKDYKLIAANNSFLTGVHAHTGKLLKTGDDVLIQGAYNKDVLTFWMNAYKIALSGTKFREEVSFDIDSDRWMDITVNPIFENGIVTGVACYGKNITEAKHAAEILLESEEKYKSVFYKSPLPKWIYDIETYDILDVNEKAIKHYGYSRDEFVTMNLRDLRPSKDIEEFEKIMIEVVKGESFSWDVVNHLKKNGDEIKVEISGHSIFYQNKKCMIVVSNDVTERENALKILKDKDAQLENAQQIAKLGYWHLNVNTQELFWSKEVYEIWGISTDINLNFNLFLSSVHIDDKENLIKNQDAVFIKGTALDVEHRIVLADGTVKWIHEKAQLEKSITGGFDYLIGTAQDITDRKNAEESIKAINQRYEHVTKATYDAIWEWDLELNTIYRAEGFERSFGFDLPQLNAPETKWEDFIHADDRNAANESIKNAIKNNADYWSHEYRIIKPNGEQAYVEDRAYILRSETGDARRVTGALRDITERKHYQDLEILERDILELNAREESKMEVVVERYLRGIEKLHPGMLGALQKIDNNRVYTIAAPSIPTTFLKEIWNKSIEEFEGDFRSCTYVKEKEIVPSIAADTRWNKNLQAVEKEGVKASWAYPVFDSKKTIIANLIFFIKTEKSPSLQEENTINRAVNILQTILEGHIREAALKESTERYINVTKATFDAIWDWDILTNHIFWGETYWEIFGKINEENLMPTVAVEERLHPDEKENVLESAKTALLGTSLNWSLEHRYLKADGSYAFVYNKALIVRNENGTAVRVFGAMQDITRQKEEEQRLKLMSSVVIGTTDPVIITEAEPFDAPGPKIVFVNDAFIKMSGYTEEEMIGNNPRMFQGPKTNRLELDKLRTAMEKWESCEVTVINYRKNGEEFWCNFTITPVADEKGWFTHWISIERDVTERKNDDLQKELLRKIRIIFNEPIGINVTLNKVLKEVTLFGDFCFAESWLVTADKKEIRRATYYVADDNIRQKIIETSNLNVQKKGEGIVGAAWKDLELKIWETSDKKINILDEHVLLNAGVKKMYALPFLNNGEIIGVLVFALDKQEPSIFKFENLFNNLKIYLGAEIRRKQLEQELDQIFTFAPDIIATIGRDGYFKKINPAASVLLDYSESELIDLPFINLIHPEDKISTLEEIKNLTEWKTASYFENRFITKTGKIKWLAFTITLSPEEDVIFAVAKNITEKKDLEVVLDKANHLARIGSWEIDLENDSLFWSDMTKEIHAVSSNFNPKLATAINFYKEGANRKIIINSLNKAINHGTPWDLELEIVTAKGKPTWIRCIGEAEFINGKCVKVYGSMQDIDERKRANENIKNSEEKRELIMNASLDAIICFNNLGIVTFWNPQAEKIFGWLEEEAMGKNLSQMVIPKKHKQDLEDGMNNYFRTSSGNLLNVMMHYTALRKNGEEFPVELTVLPIAQGGDEFFCAFIRDITERKLSETKLLELNENLQRQTYELVGINKELEQFAYVASHDLQEPLRMVTSFITQLERRYEHVLDEKGKKYIYFAVDGARRMRMIILDLLEYSKIGRIDELKEAININDLVEEISMLYSNNIEEQKAEIEYHNLPTINSYKSPLRQVFQNIISNALKYCKENNACRINITAEEMDTQWQFSIADNGIGINKDYFDKIFVIFQRLHTKEVYSGTGMGLAVTKKIIENLNGKIWVESTEGHGSVFYFTLPKD